jgi:chromosome segregation ATPase
MNENLNMSESREAAQKNRNRSIIFLITTLVFLGTTIYLAADNTHKAKMNRSLNTEMVESTNRYADLDAKYSEALIEIESYKGKSAELDSILSIKEKDINTLRANLNKEKKNRQLSESEYQKQLSDINSVITDLNAKIEALQKENGMLIIAKDSLGKNLSETQTQVTELQSTNSVLTQKVTVASLLIPQNIVVEGSRAKSSGKEAETSNAKKVEQLKYALTFLKTKWLKQVPKCSMCVSSALQVLRCRYRTRVLEYSQQLKPASR